MAGPFGVPVPSRPVPLHLQIVLAMVLGAGLGLGLNTSSSVSSELVASLAGGGRWLGSIFLTLLQMVVVPLVFSSLVASLAGLGTRQGLRRLGLRTLGYYVVTSTLAILVGLLVVNLLRPGEGLDYTSLMEAARVETDAGSLSPPTSGEAPSALGLLADIVHRMVPGNVVEASSSNRSILSVIFFAVLFGVFLLRVGGETAARLTPFFVAVQEVMMAMTQGILRLAPLGIFGYVFFVTATTGLALAGVLAWYMVTVALGLAVHGFVTLPLLLYVTTGRSPLALGRAMGEALLTAFSTASSAGTLPLTLRCATGRAGIPAPIASFTLPLGATVNMDGTALYEAVAVLFISQMLGDLTLAQQGVVAVTALAVSIGAAGIPHAGTVMMVIVMQAVGLPTDSVLVLLAVDRVLDMARTTVNVWSDAVGAAVVARGEVEVG